MKTPEGEVTVGTLSVLVLAVNGKSGLGHAEEIMEVYRESQCGIVRLQKTRRDEQGAFTAAGFTL